MKKMNKENLRDYINHEIEQIVEEMCDKFCKYPEMNPPKGKDCDWLYDVDGPCSKCPLSKL